MKRLLSWLLALVMIISCLPMSAIPAFAEEKPETGVGDIQNPDFEGPMDKLDPVVIEEFAWTYTPAVQIAGDAEGNFYIYTAPADGTVTLYFTEVPESVKKYEGDIIVTVNDKVYSLKENGVNNYGLELQIPVKKDDVLEINTKLTADHQGNANPAGKYTWCGNFAYPAGSEQNPINIVWTWDDAHANATASVTVPEGGAYYTGKAGMILTVGETVTAMDETGKFNIAAAGTYELKLATPVGAQANPEVIENINGFSDTVKLEAEGAYYYIWTATENGTVTLDVTEGANIVVDQIVEMSEDGQPVSVQHQLAAVEYDDNWNAYWAVADNLAIEVVAGQQLKIQVNGLTDWATWTVPAIEYTLTGSFEPAEPEVVIYDIPVSATNLEFADELFLSAKLKLPEEIMNDANAIVRMQINGGNTDFLVADLVAAGLDSSGRVKVKQPIMSPYMDKMVTIYVIDGNGNSHNFIYSEVKHEGSYVFSVDNYLKLAFAQGDSYKTTKDLLVALLTYGSAAQEYFTMRGGVPNISKTPASQLLEKYGYSALDLSKFSADMITQEVIKEGAQNGVTFKNCTPAFEAALYMTMKFESDGSYDMNDYTYTLKYYDASSRTEKTTELVPFKDNQGRFCVKIENVAAALWDYMYKVTVTNKVTGESYSASYSVMCYVKAAVAAYANDAVRLAFFKSLYYYNQAANTRFGV